MNKTHKNYTQSAKFFKTEQIPLTPLLTGQEAAKALRVSLATLIRLIKAGRMAGIKIGGQWRVSPAALQAFIKSSQAKGADSESQGAA